MDNIPLQDEIAEIYHGDNDILRYIEVNNIYRKEIQEYIVEHHKKKSNGIKIDTFLFKNINNIDLEEKDDLLKEIYNNGVMNGQIFHQEQIYNALGKKIDIYKKNNRLYIKENDLYIDLGDYVRDKLYNRSFEQVIKEITLIDEKYNSLDTPENNLLCVFIGDVNVGNELLEKIIKYKNRINDKFYLGVTFRTIDICRKLEVTITENFDNYVIFISKEYGNDITPTLQMYYHFSEDKKYNYKYVIKLHTKSHKEQFNLCVDYILGKKNRILKELLSITSNASKTQKTSNCVGYPNFHIPIKNDRFNKLLIDKYNKYIDLNKSFVATTNFFCEKSNMDKIIEFLKENNYNSFFLMNMYDNNYVNKEVSPVHFLERLFGVII